MKKTMTINLSEQEMDALEALCAKKDLSKTALVKQALRLYQALEERIDRGDKIFYESPDKEKAEIFLL